MNSSAASVIVEQAARAHTLISVLRLVVVQSIPCPRPTPMGTRPTRYRYCATSAPPTVRAPPSLRNAIVTSMHYGDALEARLEIEKEIEVQTRTIARLYIVSRPVRSQGLSVWSRSLAIFKKQEVGIIFRPRCASPQSPLRSRRIIHNLFFLLVRHHRYRCQRLSDWLAKAGFVCGRQLAPAPLVSLSLRASRSRAPRQRPAGVVLSPSRRCC